MKKSTDISKQLIWTQAGDHRAEAEGLLAKNSRENGRLTGNPSIIVRKFPAGVFTLLAADAPWWLDELRLHPDWQGPVENDSAFFDSLDELGAPQDKI